MWPIIWWYLGYIWPVLAIFGLVGVLFGVAVWSQRERPMSNCFICERPGTVRLYATVAVCDDHANGIGGDPLGQSGAPPHRLY